MVLRTSARRSAARRWWSAGPVVIAPVVVALLAAGCGTGDSGVPASQSVPAGGGQPISGPRTSVPARTGISTTITTLGTVLSSDGFTLYRYAKDRAAPPRSTCTGGCASTWPPVVVTPPLGGTGMDPALLGTVARPDGEQQLTVGGWPVYRFARDTAPGDVKGQGGGRGAWTAIGFDGQPLAGDAPRGAPATDADQP